MPLQPPTYIGNLDSTNPRGTDPRTISDDVHRNIQESCRMTLPNLTGEVTADHNDLNTLTGLGAGTRSIMTGTSGTTIIWMHVASPPVGWTLETWDGNVRNLAWGGGKGYGGSEDPTFYNESLSCSVSGFTLYAGGHTHTGWTDGPSASSNVQTSGGTVAATSAHTHNVGMNSVSDHRHNTSLSGSTSATSWYPRYATGILTRLA